MRDHHTRVLDSCASLGRWRLDMFFLQALSGAAAGNVTMATSARYFRLKN